MNASEFHPGDKCKVTLEGTTYTGHIQSILKNIEKATVYIEELGEKHDVSLRSLVLLHHSTFIDSELDKTVGSEGERRSRSRKRKSITVPESSSSDSQSPSVTYAARRIDERRRAKSASPRFSRRSESTGDQLMNAFGGPQKFSRGRHRIYSDDHVRDERSRMMYEAGARQTPDDSPRYLGARPTQFQHYHYMPSRESMTYGESVPPHEKMEYPHGEMMHRSYGYEGPCEGASRPEYPPESGPMTYPVPYPYMSYPPASSQSAAPHNPGYTPAVPFYPYMPIAHPESMPEPINLGAPFSRDPHGSDLPHQDASTLRFFYNLGVQYHRMMGAIHQSQYPPPPPPPPPPAQVPSAGYGPFPPPYMPYPGNMEAAPGPPGMPQPPPPPPPENYVPVPVVDPASHGGHPAAEDSVVVKDAHHSENYYGNHNRNVYNDVRSADVVPSPSITRKCEVVHVGTSDTPRSDTKGNSPVSRGNVNYMPAADCDILSRYKSQIDSLKDDAVFDDDAHSRNDGVDDRDDEDDEDNAATCRNDDDSAESNDEEYTVDFDEELYVQQPVNERDAHGHGNSSEDSGCVSESGSGNGECTAVSDVDEATAQLQKILNINVDNSSRKSRSEIKKQDNYTNGCPETNLADLIEREKPYFKKTPAAKTTNNPCVKIVRPMKEIPPRFKKILESAAMSRNTAAVRHQFEGMPLVRQNRELKSKLLPQPLQSPQPPLRQPPQQQQQPRSSPHGPPPTCMSEASGHKFNPNAPTFIPSQPNDQQDEESEQVQSSPGPSQPRSSPPPQPPPPASTSMPENSPPVYTIHVVNSSSCNIEGGCSNMCLSSTHLPSPAGTYTATSVHGQYGMPYMGPHPPPPPPPPAGHHGGPAFVYQPHPQYVYSQ